MKKVNKLKSIGLYLSLNLEKCFNSLYYSNFLILNIQLIYQLIISKQIVVIYLRLYIFKCLNSLWFGVDKLMKLSNSIHMTYLPFIRYFINMKNII